MRKKIVGIILLLALPLTAPAETLVLLQGYLGDEGFPFGWAHSFCPTGTA